MAQFILSGLLALPIPTGVALSLTGAMLFPKSHPSGEQFCWGATFKQQHWKGMGQAKWDMPTGIVAHICFSLQDWLW